MSLFTRYSLHWAIYNILRIHFISERSDTVQIHINTVWALRESGGICMRFNFKSIQITDKFCKFFTNSSNSITEDAILMCFCSDKAKSLQNKNHNGFVSKLNPLISTNSRGINTPRREPVWGYLSECICVRMYLSMISLCFIFYKQYAVHYIY